jgi:hypothetical protein
MWWILETLRLMDNKPFSPYSDVTAQIGGCWTASLAASGQSKGLEEPDGRRLGRWLAQLFAVVDLHFSRLRYSGWRRAQDLAEELRESQIPKLKTNDCISDLLNAAWLCRSQVENANSYFISWLTEQSLKLCMELIDKAD